MKINKLPSVSGQKEIDPKQGVLDLSVEKETEIHGIGMGVLSDGTPFLSQRGLARLCGVENAHIGTISSQWGDGIQKPRITAIKDLLARRGVSVEQAHIEVTDGQRVIFAYPDHVCLAVLEYYAFEAGPNCKNEARDNYRLLAGQALRDFIYTQVGYNPAKRLPQVWDQFHDRVSLVYDNVPAGYFGVFKEMADMIVTLIRGGADVGPGFVPDMSVGGRWATYWKDNNLVEKYGDRIAFMHEYPDYFPQAKSNPQTPWAYPELALPEFRRWMRDTYIPEHLPTYLDKKEREGLLPPSFAEIAVKQLAAKSNPKSLPN